MVRIRAQRLIVGCVAGRLEDSFSCSVRNQRLLHPSQIHAGTKERERVHFFHFTPAIPKGKGIDRHEQPEKHDDGFLMAFALCVQLLIPADEGRKPRAKVSSTDVFPPHTKKERKKKRENPPAPDRCLMSRPLKEFVAREDRWNAFPHAIQLFRSISRTRAFQYRMTGRRFNNCIRSESLERERDEENR